MVVGRVSGTALNPLTGPGELVIGGGGSPVGYQNVALDALGAVASAISSSGSEIPIDLIDGDDGTTWRTANTPVAGKWISVNLGAPKRIGRMRLLQTTQAGWFATGVTLASSDDGTTWTNRKVVTSLIGGEAPLAELAVPITAQHWRLWADAGGSQAWRLHTWELHEVLTVGAGNQTRLAAPTAKRHLTFDVASSTPVWEAPAAAIADLGATVGVDVAAAAGTQVATKAELDATNAKVNAILAALRGEAIVSAT